MNLLTKQKETHSLRQQTHGCQGEGIIREFGKVMYLLLYSKWITNKDLLYSTWDCTQCYVQAWLAWLVDFLGTAPHLQPLLTGLWGHLTQHKANFLGGSDSKASAYNEGDPGSIPGSGRSPGEGNGNTLQYSCLENPMDGEAW